MKKVEILLKVYLSETMLQIAFIYPNLITIEHLKYLTKLPTKKEKLMNTDQERRLYMNKKKQESLQRRKELGLFKQRSFFYLIEHEPEIIEFFAKLKLSWPTVKKEP